MKLLNNTAVYLDRFIRREINYYLLRPTNLLLFLTYRCTSRCRPCSMWKRKVSDIELTLDEWKRLIDMLADYGIRNVEMFGGDALLRKDVLFPLTVYIKQKGIPKVELVTNCNLMDPGAVDDVLEVGMDVVTTSLDGVGEGHDRIRGVAGTFDKVKNCLEYLIRMKKDSPVPKVVVSCTVSALNVEYFEKVFSFGVDVGADNVAFEYAGEFPPESVSRSKIEGLEPEPYFTPQESSILLNREQAILLKRKLRAIKENAGGTDVYVNSANIDVLTIENLVSGLLPNKRCYVCRYMVIVDPYGNVIPCPFFNNYHLGNIRDQHFDRIWNNQRHRAFVKYADEGKLDMCRHCILGVERNPTLMQSIRKAYCMYTRKGYDENIRGTERYAALRQ